MVFCGSAEVIHLPNYFGCEYGRRLDKKVQFENKEPFRLDIVQPGGVTLILYTLSLSQIFNEPYKDRGYFGAGGGGFGGKKVVRLA